jgi:hypothetical protein
MGGKLTTLSMTDRILTLAALLTACGIVAMGADNTNRLARCESAGRSAAECRLVVLGR